MDSIVQAVKELKNICDAVDITDFSSSSNSCSTDEHERWKSWLSCIHQIYQVCETPLLCKLSFSRQTVDDTIRKGKSLQEAGCQVILSEGHLIRDNILLRLAGFQMGFKTYFFIFAHLMRVFITAV